MDNEFECIKCSLCLFPTKVKIIQLKKNYSTIQLSAASIVEKGRDW
jgi:hypothetical protein